MSQTFTAKVHRLVRQIPVGKVATYQDVADGVDSPKASRAVGTAMKRNPDPRHIACHRVVGSDGSMHGYAFGEGVATKWRLLVDEGVRFVGNKVDLATSRWHE